jgi:poly(A) polymerase
MTQVLKTSEAGLPVVLPRAEHGISRKSIDEHTLKVMYRLSRQGYKAYLVGGGVRDLLLGRTPKDFDVGTDATPNQVKKLHRNCFLVGRRFRLAHVRFGRDLLVEVATFRRQAGPDDLPEDPDDHFFFTENIFGTPQEDAFRRDFTINALFYDIKTFSIIDYVGGLADLEARRLRVIGDPLVRFTEDPVRMLRALEFAARLDFTLDDTVRQGIHVGAPLIAKAAPARIREEVMELFRHRVGGEVLRTAQGFGLLPHLLAGFEGEEETFVLLDRIDARTASGVQIEEYFVLAALYLHRFLHLCRSERERTVTEAVQLAGLVLSPHCNYFHVAHGVRHLARELLISLFRLSRGTGKRGERRFLQHSMTLQALELFELRHGGDSAGVALAAEWHKALSQVDVAQERRVPDRRKPRRPRRRPRKPNGGGGAVT